MIIDSHHHFWHYNTEEFGWIDDSMAVIRRDFLPEDLKRVIGEAQVDKVISVQAPQNLEENEFLLKHAEENDFIAGIVGWLPLSDSSALEASLDRFAKHDKFVGVRHIVQGEDDDEFILGESFNQGVAKILNQDLAYDILILEKHLKPAIQFADRHEGQRLVLDHIAKPKIAAGEMEPWRENMFELAKREHVYCKISGVVTEADFSIWKEEELLPYIEIALEAFGPKRVMFGSDWPVMNVGMAYTTWVDMLKKCTSSLSEDEKANFWGKNAIEAYKLKL
jgi:L-fuconolactonase